MLSLANLPEWFLDLTMSSEGILDHYPIKSEAYCKQLQDWSCGIAIYQMTMMALLSQEVGEAEGIKVLGTVPGSPTDNSRLVEVLASHPELDVREYSANLNPQLFSATPQSILAPHLERKSVTIINYIEPEEGVGHYAIVQDVKETGIILADPTYGPHYFVDWSKFDWRSGFQDVRLHRWHVAVNLA